MSKPNYRVVLSFDAERKVFVARSPELEPCFAEGATRGEAISKLEQEIEALLMNMQERGHRPPAAVDEAQWSGEITARVSRTLHRDLAWQARSEGVELAQLVSELLAASLEGRRQQRPQRIRPSEPQPEPGNAREPERERPQRGYGSRYHNLMEDRANFIEYVRNLEAEARDPQRGGRPRPQGDRGEARDGRNGRNRRRRWKGDRPRPEGGPPAGGAPSGTPSDNEG